MQLEYRFFYGGSRNPFEKEAVDAYRKLSEERKVADRRNLEPIEKVFPTLDSWPRYVIAESKSTFWKMERELGMNAEAKAQEIETIWKEALDHRKVDKWILEVDGNDTAKAMCYYIKVLHGMFAPNDRTVDFRLYFSESIRGRRVDENSAFSLTPYED